MKNTTKPNLIKKFIITLSLIIFQLISCNTSKVDDKIITKSDLSEFEKFLVDFSERNKQGSNNSISQDETNKIFKKELETQLKKSDTCLSFIDFELKDVFLYKNSYYGHFINHGEYQKSVFQDDNKSKLISLTVDLICKLNLPKEDILKMKEGNQYKIIGEFVDLPNFIEVLMVKKLNFWNGFIDISIGKYTSKFDLGLIEFSSKEIIQLPSPKY